MNSNRAVVTMLSQLTHKGVIISFHVLLQRESSCRFQCREICTSCVKQEEQSHTRLGHKKPLKGRTATAIFVDHGTDTSLS